MQDKNKIWIFGYGSLMWNPGFPYQEVQPARLDGYQRDLCILSYVFRGTPECPGLVLGLTPGGECQGRAFRIAPQDQKSIFDYLDGREMINNVYKPAWVDIELEDARIVSAYTFIAIKDHPQYVGDQTVETKLSYLLQGVGKNGTSIQYLENTCQHLRELSIQDHALEAFLRDAQHKKA